MTGPRPSWPRRSRPTVRACIEAGADLLRAGRPLDDACEHACSLASESERGAVRVGVETIAAERAA